MLKGKNILSNSGTFGLIFIAFVMGAMEEKKEKTFEMYPMLPDEIQTLIGSYSDLPERLFTDNPAITKIEVIATLKILGKQFINGVYEKIKHIRNRYLILRNSTNQTLNIEIALDNEVGKTKITGNRAQESNWQDSTSYFKGIFTIPAYQNLPVALPPRFIGTSFYMGIGRKDVQGPHLNIDWCTMSYYQTLLALKSGSVINIAPSLTKNGIAIIRSIIIRNMLNYPIILHNRTDHGQQRVILAKNIYHSIYNFDWQSSLPENPICKSPILGFATINGKLIKSLTLQEISPFAGNATVIEISPRNGSESLKNFPNSTEPEIKIQNIFNPGTCK